MKKRIKCKICQKTTEIQNIFEGQCVDCMVEYSINFPDALNEDFDITMNIKPRGE